MNIEQLEKKYQELGVAYAELGKEIEARKLKEVDREWPKIGDEYYFINSVGKVDCSHRIKDDLRIEIGNFYRTAKDAIAQVDALKVVAELCKYEGYCHFRLGHNNYSIIPNLRLGSVNQNMWTESDAGWQSVYFESDKCALDAIRKVGEKQILKAARWFAMGITE